MLDHDTATERAVRLLIDRAPGPGSRLDAFLLLAGQEYLWRGVGPGADFPEAVRRYEAAIGRTLSASLTPSYGVDRFTATPEARLGLSDSQRELGLGWRLALDGSGPVTMELGLEGTRSEPRGGDGEAVNALMLRGTLRW